MVWQRSIRNSFSFGIAERSCCNLKIGWSFCISGSGESLVKASFRRSRINLESSDDKGTRPPIQRGIMPLFCFDFLTCTVISLTLTNSRFNPAKKNTTPGFIQEMKSSSIVPRNFPPMYLTCNTASDTMVPMLKRCLMATLRLVTVNLSPSISTRLNSSYASKDGPPVVMNPNTHCHSSTVMY